MHIYVHSAGRAHLPLPTLDILMLGPLKGHVRLVVQAREEKKYKESAHAIIPDKQIIVLPKDIQRLSPTRQWLLENGTPKFVLMDDDLQFAIRRVDDPTKFTNAEPQQVAHKLARMEVLLDRYAHVGFMAREGANRVFTDQRATRMMRVLGYNRDAVLATGARFDRLPTKQDFDMTLQLLRAGLPNLVMADIVHNQRGSNTSGGCSRYRTQRMMDDSAKVLAKLHPGFVKVVTKETKTAWGGGTRTDVQISWKKALAEGRR